MSHLTSGFVELVPTSYVVVWSLRGYIVNMFILSDPNCNFTELHSESFLEYNDLSLISWLKINVTLTGRRA